MQPFDLILEHVPAEFVGWAIIVAGLGVFAVALRMLDRGRSVAVTVAAPAQIEQLRPSTEFQKIMDVSLVELTTRPDLRSIHLDALTMVDAADHAINRLRADCARVSAAISPPSFLPPGKLSREPALAASKAAPQQPLAA